MGYHPKHCRTDGLEHDLGAEEIEHLKFLLWNWARMLAEQNPQWIKDPMVARKLIEPMLNLMQKGIDRRDYQ